jgi:hypothetical protein
VSFTTDANDKGDKPKLAPLDGVRVVLVVAQTSAHSRPPRRVAFARITAIASRAASSVFGKGITTGAALAVPVALVETIAAATLSIVFLGWSSAGDTACSRIALAVALCCDKYAAKCSLRVLMLVTPLPGCR